MRLRDSSDYRRTPGASHSAISRSKSIHSSSTWARACSAALPSRFRRSGGAVAVRVLHLTTEFPPIIYGGLGTATGGLVSALARASVDVAVLLLGPATGSSYGQFRPLARYPAAQVRRYGGVTIFEVSWFLDLESIIRIVKRWRPDILHLHSFWMWHIAGALRQGLNVPLVYTVHSLDRASTSSVRGRLNASGNGRIRRARSTV